MKTFSPEQQGYRDFDLPTEHLPVNRHYIPPKAHDKTEIARRRELTPGTLRAEAQKKGLIVARTILEQVTDPEGLVFAANTLAVAGLNTAWYSYAQKSDVMRRRLKLPIMAHRRTRTPELVLEDCIDALGKQIGRADQLVTATDLMLRSRADHQRRLGVGVGNTSLHLAMLQPVINGVFEEVADDEIRAQELVRIRALDMLEQARTLHTVVGSHPSIAQLSDPYSHLSVYWYRHAPGSAQAAVVESLAA